MEWLQLVYRVPAEPTRKRTYVWRQLRGLGAVYLQDGCCVLPRTPGAEAGLIEVAGKVREFGGEATLSALAAAEAELKNLDEEAAWSSRPADDAADVSQPVPFTREAAFEALFDQVPNDSTLKQPPLNAHPRTDFEPIGWEAENSNVPGQVRHVLVIRLRGDRSGRGAGCRPDRQQCGDRGAARVGHAGKRHERARDPQCGSGWRRS